MSKSRYKRRASVKLPKKKFYLVCEGANTEPTYFSALVNRDRNSLIELILIAPGGAPSTLVEKAEEIKSANNVGGRGTKKSLEANDEVWAVFDRDEHPSYDLARKRCMDKKIQLAYSDPCFELWLILHSQDHDSTDDRHRVQKIYSSIDPAYASSGSKKANCAQLLGGVEEAERRAAALLLRREQEGMPLGCPSTTVHLLTKKLRCGD